MRVTGIVANVPVADVAAPSLGVEGEGIAGGEERRRAEE